MDSINYPNLNLGTAQAQPSQFWWPSNSIAGPAAPMVTPSLQNQFKPDFAPSWTSLQSYGPKAGPNFGAPTAAVAQANQPLPATSSLGPLPAGNAQAANVNPNMAYSMPSATGAAGGPFDPASAWKFKNPKDWNGQDIANYNSANQPSNVGAYAQMGLQGVQMAGQLGLGIASLVQGQEAFNRQMGMADKNYAAQISAYNLALEDKIKGRYSLSERAAKSKQIEDEIKSKQQKA